MTEHATLDPEKILATSKRLEARIRERFPESGLARVCHRLVTLADDARETCEDIRRPQIPIRIASVFIIALMLTAIVAAAWLALRENSVGGHLSWSDLVAHLIDVHQLTKTPYRAREPEQTETTAAPQTHSSPTRHMTRFQMSRYLDYCSEMLALTGKISALYGDDFGDAEALEAVNDVEALTIGLQRKIWQKMMLLSGTPSDDFGDDFDEDLDEDPDDDEPDVEAATTGEEETD